MILSLTLGAQLQLVLGPLAEQILSLTLGAQLQLVLGPRAEQILIPARARKIDFIGRPSNCFHLAVLLIVSRTEDFDGRTQIPMDVLPK